MESETTKVLPCPFCGSIYTECATNDDVFWVRCTANNCEAEGPHRPTRAAAIAAHNRIASAVADRDHAALTAERDALRAQVAQLRVFKAAYDSEADYQERTSNHDNYRDQARSRQAQWDAVKGLLAALAATEPTPEATR